MNPHILDNRYLRNVLRRARASRYVWAFLLVMPVISPLVIAQTAGGKTVNAASCSLPNVQSAVGGASNGDTVIVPAGNCTWNDSLSLTKAITLRGAGKDKTVIAIGTSGTFAVRVVTPSSGRVRITDVGFDGRKTGQGVHVTGGLWTEFQIDNCKFSEMNGRAIEIQGILSGLVHSNRFVDNLKSVDTYALGDRDLSWATPLTLGTTKSVVVEDNEFTFNSWYPRTAGAVSSHGFGGRATWRFNSFTNNKPGLDFFPIIDAHGNQQKVNGQNHLVEPPRGTGPHRGTRQLELYGNTFSSNVGQGSTAAPAQIRGGTVLIYDNVYSGGDVGGSFEMREEDGPDRFNYLTSYPGYDPHMVWLWNNTSNGNAMGWYSKNSAAFVIEGTNIFKYPKPGYTPLSYPHPWRVDNPPAPAPPPNLAAPSNLRLK